MLDVVSVGRQSEVGRTHALGERRSEPSDHIRKGLPLRAPPTGGARVLAEQPRRGVGEAAQRGAPTPDGLDAALAPLPVPLVGGESDVVDDLVIWTAHTDIFDVDPQAPQPTLEQIFAASWETS